MRSQIQKTTYSIYMYSWKGRSIGPEIRSVMARGLDGEDGLQGVMKEFGGNKKVLYVFL